MKAILRMKKITKYTRERKTRSTLQRLSFIYHLSIKLFSFILSLFSDVRTSKGVRKAFKDT